MRINHENKSMDMEARDINYILPAYVRSYLFYSKNEMPEKIIFPMFPSIVVGDKEIPIEYVPPLDAIAVEIAEDGKSVAEVTPEQEAKIDEKDEEIKNLKAEVESLTTVERGKEGLGGKATEPEICGAYAENWKELGKPEGWTGCPLPKGHEGAHGGETEDTQPVPAPEDLIRQQEEAAIPDEPEFVPVPEKEVTDGLTEEEQTYEAAKADQPVSPAKAAYHIDPNPAHQPPPGRQPGQPPGGDIGAGMPLSDMHSRDRKDQIRTAKDLAVEPEIEGTPEKEFEKEISRGEDGKPIVEDKPDA